VGERKKMSENKNIETTIIYSIMHCTVNCWILGKQDDRDCK
jgi:hypothetical protein